MKKSYLKPNSKSLALIMTERLMFEEPSTDEIPVGDTTDPYDPSTDQILAPKKVWDEGEQ